MLVIALLQRIPEYVLSLSLFGLAVLSVLCVSVPYKVRPESEHLKYLKGIGVLLIVYVLSPELQLFWHGEFIISWEKLGLIAGLQRIAGLALPIGLGVALIRRQRIAVLLAAAMCVLSLIPFLRFVLKLDFSYWAATFFMLLAPIMFGFIWRYAWLSRKHGLLQ